MSSKADKLGAGRFGGSTAGVSARRQAVAAATGVPTEGIAAPTELPVHRISPNPDNPRTRLGDLTELAGSLRTHGQKQAITVMNRDAYVKANPDHEAALEPDTTYVVIDGSSRLAAAREAGLATIKVMVSDDQGVTADELLESALVANIHRQALEELDEARALERLLNIHGTQTALAKRLHRSQGWVSQRLALLTLTPELQERIGEEPIDLLRAVGKRPADQQQAALEELKARRAREEAEKASQQRRKQHIDATPLPQPTSVQHPDEAAAVDTSSAGDDARGVTKQPEVQEDAAALTVVAARERKIQPTDGVPEPRTNSNEAAMPRAEAGTRTPPRLPYDDGVFLAHHLIRKMSDVEFTKMLHLLNHHQEAKVAARRS
ncbi:ParB/RepB/Spo0J family partition protein [Streptomyces sp. NPDC002952]|uniref:ParB/RepB/Spo0J family partition protein n=1 Tax=Streptomyces sp. NPDC002952 TaxID=3364673 RepID=UPI0036BA36AC